MQAFAPDRAPTHQRGDGAVDGKPTVLPLGIALSPERIGPLRGDEPRLIAVLLHQFLGGTQDVDSVDDGSLTHGDRTVPVRRQALHGLPRPPA